MALKDNYYNFTEENPTVGVELSTNYILRGNHYYAGFELRPLIATGVKDYLFKTGNTQIIIDNQNIGSRSQDFDFIIYEDATVSADGAPIPIFNSNRPLQNEADFISTVGFFDTPTITDIGNLLIRYPVFAAVPAGGGGNNKSVVTAAVGGFGKEFVLKKNTNYIIRVDNNLTLSADSDIAFQVNWHEDRKSIGGV